MRIRSGQMVHGVAALVIVACCTLDSGAQVQLPTVQNPIKDIGRVAITPDGRRVLYSATDIKGVSGTWLKDVRTGVVTRFEVSDQPDFRGGVFSPDGQWLVFFSQRDSTLRRVRISGGSSTKICDVSSGGPMDWGDDDRIVFSQPKRVPHDPFGATPVVAEIRRVPAAGGEPELVMTLKEREGVIGIQVLPGSRAAIMTIENDRTTRIVAQPLDGGASRMLIPSASHFRYLPSKEILVYRPTRPSPIPEPLATVPFDRSNLRLTGPTERLAVDATWASEISATGTLAHASRPIDLVRVFRDGSRRSLGMLPEGASMPRVSPDGRRIVYSSNGLWIADLARLESTMRRLTLDTTDWMPVWSPDGRSVAFGREVREPGTETSTEGFVWWRRAIYSIAVDGRSPAQRLALHGDTPVFWSPVTGRLAYERYIDGVDRSLWTTAPGEKTSRLVFRSSDPLRAALSRDGKWLAFEWTRGGASGFDDSTYIYVSPFRSGGTPIEMPGGDAHNPVWSRSGDELFFAKDGRLLVTQLRTSTFSALTFSEPVMVYDTGQRSESRYFRSFEYDVMPDGASVLVKVSSSPRIEVVPDVWSRRIQ